MKVLILSILLLLGGCFPGGGGYVQVFGTDEGATGPVDEWPLDTLAVVTWFVTLENLSPVELPGTLDNLCARAGVTSQLINNQFLPNSFLENGVSQFWMETNKTVGINGKLITFVEESVTLKSFYDIDFNPIPPPEEILPGTLVLVGALATENGIASTRWVNTYLLKLDTGNYVWYGNQNDTENVQEARAFGVYDYFEDFELKGPQTVYTQMNNFYGNKDDPTQKVLTFPLPASFLEDGVDQENMYLIGSNLHGVEVKFNYNTIEIINFYTINDFPIDPRPTPETIIPGTKVAVNIDATEDGLTSTRFLNTILILLDDGSYVWYGNQIPTTSSFRRHRR